MSLRDALDIAARMRRATEGFQVCAKCRDMRKATYDQTTSVSECGLCVCAACGSHQATVKTRAVLEAEGYKP